MDNLITMDKQYKTRDGRAVRVLCVDNFQEDSDFPVLAIVDGCVFSFTNTGGFYSHKEDEFDLVEVLEEKELWLEIYQYGSGNLCTTHHNSLERMENSIKYFELNIHYQLIATKKITYVEGERCE